MKTASISAFIEGEVVELDPKYSRSFSFSGINTATYGPLASIKVNRIFNGESCFGEFDILRIAGANTVNNQAVTIGLFLGGELSGEVNYQYNNEANSIVSYANLIPAGAGANTIENLSDLSPIYELVIASDSSLSINLSHLKLTFGLGRDLIIAIKTTASVTGFVSVNWFEQQ